eukprot:gnl/TRDRNA2_/TRDRNA2_178426_c0_seq1.p1 gnl/TRDRNA2_/TRDRNA2_178426_c0~~gnl/TRDRNA2_/TRDRNA2_178426_c0_seq1.p1  ORF type:complete len:422 (-),score=72.13 gnl/TRDRNA2_/TRDRNA2_178426_c0_seq1:312-1577(-)
MGVSRTMSTQNVLEQSQQQAQQAYQLCWLSPGVAGWFPIEEAVKSGRVAVAVPHGLTPPPMLTEGDIDVCSGAFGDTAICQPLDPSAAKHVPSELGTVSAGIGGASQRRRRQRATAAKKAAGATLRHPANESVETAINYAVRDPWLAEFDMPFLTTQLETGGAARDTALAALTGHVQALAFDEAGCRLVQTALKVATQHAAKELLDELRGSVYAACQCPNANYVIQKAVEVLPARLAAVVAEELSDVAVKVARHRYGCRILCRLVEHHCGDGADGPARKIIDRLLIDAVELCRHTYGHHVVNSILEHGSDEQRHIIAEALRIDAMHNGKNRHASFVIETALSCCSNNDVNALAFELLGKPGNIAALAASQFGCHVARALLRVPGELSALAVDQLYRSAPKLAESKYGRRVLEEPQMAAAAA